MPNTKHIYDMIELIDKEKIRGRKMSDIKVSIIMPVYKVEEYMADLFVKYIRATFD